MPRPRKVTTDAETTFAGQTSGTVPALTPVGEFLKLQLRQLLMQRTPAIFDREPAPGFNGNLDSLVQEIINLFV